MFLLIIVTLVVWALIFYVLFWGLARLAPIAPFYKIIETVLVIAVVIVLIGVLTGKVAPFPFLNGLVK